MKILEVIATIFFCALIVFLGVGSCWLVYEKDKRKKDE